MDYKTPFIEARKVFDRFYDHSYHINPAMTIENGKLGLVVVTIQPPDYRGAADIVIKLEKALLDDSSTYWKIIPETVKWLLGEQKLVLEVTYTHIEDELGTRLLVG